MNMIVNVSVCVCVFHAVFRIEIWFVLVLLRGEYNLNA